MEDKLFDTGVAWGEIPSDAVTPEEKNFELARKAYPGKKRGFRTEFNNFKRRHRDWRELCSAKVLTTCIEKMRLRNAYSPDFWPMFQTFINQRRWEEAAEGNEKTVQPVRAVHVCACGCGSTSCHIQLENKWWVDGSHYRKVAVRK